MFGFGGFWRWRSRANSVRGGRTRSGEAYGEAMLAGWVTPPADSVPGPTHSVPQAQPDDAVLERFYRNQD